MPGAADVATGGRSCGRALGGRRVERDLEIRLDLRVVGGEHAVPGVRRLAVDGLAALPGLVRLGPGRGLLLLRRLGQ